ncbi:MAG: DUF1622 domain-containing protein [Lachnospiraceae bacterium]|nr:DUF1622 domain-containing protein [Lachnospiraceae bacterium]
MNIENIIHFLENTFLTDVVAICTFFLEMAGIIVLITTSAKCFIKWLQKKSHVQLDLAHGTALALTFKMGGEVLRTVVVREWQELGILGAIIVLRAALTIMLHWEIKSEEKVLDNEKLKEMKKY